MRFRLLGLFLLPLFILLLGCAGGSFLVRSALPNRVAVIQKAEVDVHSGTDRNTVVQFKLHAGTEAAWLETRDAWLRIALPDDKQGWVHSEDVEALVL